MPLWKKLLITVVVMLAASFIAGQIWNKIFNTYLPSYVGGIIGGLAALPGWEMLGKAGAKK